MKQTIKFISILLIFFSCKGQIKQKTEPFQILTNQELKLKSINELRLFRNEVFARKGYVFKDGELNNYFKAQSWYIPNNDNNTIVFSEKEQVYIYEIKKTEKTLALNTNRKCLSNLSKQYSDLYPLTNKDLLNEKFKYSKQLYGIEIQSPSPMIKGNLCGGGSVWNLKCSGNVNYQLLFYTCDSDNLYMSLAIIKNEDDMDFLKLYGTYVHDFKNVDKYSFILDHDNLDIIKTNYTNTEDYKEKEVSKEVKKYKLTDNGIIEL